MPKTVGSPRYWLRQTTTGLKITCWLKACLRAAVLCEFGLARADMSEVGFGQIDYRCFIPFLFTGMRLFRRTQFDVVLFSSTVFLSFVLGPIWKRMYGCKIVYDYQDPWYYGDEQPYTKQTVPGKWWKFRLGQFIARVLEPISLRRANHIISVSQGYVDMLISRYEFLSRDRFTVLPFPASNLDYEFVDRHAIGQTVFSDDGKIRWVYVGRGGHDMHLTLSMLFRQLALLIKQKPELRSILRLYFIGTSYAPAGTGAKTIEPVAREFGVADMVIERPDRIPYFEAISLHRQSDLILIVGSESSDYTASKLFNCVISGRKVLALFHRDSLVSALAKDIPSVFLATFDPKSGNNASETEVMSGLKWALSTENDDVADNQDSIRPWLADASTKSQCEIFDRL